MGWTYIPQLRCYISAVASGVKLVEFKLWGTIVEFAESINLMRNSLVRDIKIIFVRLVVACQRKIEIG